VIACDQKGGREKPAERRSAPDKDAIVSENCCARLGEDFKKFQFSL
jgi:hypothetical protein